MYIYIYIYLHIHNYNHIYIHIIYCILHICMIVAVEWPPSKSSQAWSLMTSASPSWAWKAVILITEGRGNVNSQSLVETLGWTDSVSNDLNTSSWDLRPKCSATGYSLNSLKRFGKDRGTLGSEPQCDCFSVHKERITVPMKVRCVDRGSIVEPSQKKNSICLWWMGLMWPKERDMDFIPKTSNNSEVP